MIHSRTKNADSVLESYLYRREDVRIKESSSGQPLAGWGTRYYRPGKFTAADAARLGALSRTRRGAACSQGRWRPSLRSRLRRGAGRARANLDRRADPLRIEGARWHRHSDRREMAGRRF